MSDMDLDFDSWYGILQDVARAKGHNVSDQDAWREEFDAGKWPEDAIRDEFGE